MDTRQIHVIIAAQPHIHIAGGVVQPDLIPRYRHPSQPIPPETGIGTQLGTGHVPTPVQRIALAGQNTIVPTTPQRHPSQARQATRRTAAQRQHKVRPAQQRLQIKVALRHLPHIAGHRPHQRGLAAHRETARRPTSRTRPRLPQPPLNRSQPLVSHHPRNLRQNHAINLGQPSGMLGQRDSRPPHLHDKAQHVRIRRRDRV